jgi:DNA-directed RNA polymerase specialized sigma24 family protein
MRKNWDFTKEEFDRFLYWLDPDPEKSGKKYEAIQRNLIILLKRRGCLEPEDVADEAIDRVVRQVQRGLAETYQGEPAAYFITVAYHVCEERRKRPPLSALQSDPPAPSPPDSDRESMQVCLDQCLDKLSGSNRALVLRYYREDRQSKIDDRKKLAEELGIDLNALRIRVFRIRAKLAECIESCLGGPAGNGLEPVLL